MPPVSKAQNRLVHALADKGVKWAKKWASEQHGHKVPPVERKTKKKRIKRKAKPPRAS